jgi:4-amino-4-deoxy-L-arabinose transferase-like glycosyltransferase
MMHFLSRCFHSFLKGHRDQEKVDISVIFLLGFLLRLCSFYLVRHIIFPDTQTYMQAGEDLWTTGRVSSTVVMPLYPLILYGLGKGLTSFVGILASSATGVFIYLIALQITGRRLLALACGLFLAIYPLHIYYSSLLLTESFFIFFLYGSLWAFYGNRFLLGSFLIGMSLLIRPALMYVGPFLVIAFSRGTHGKTWKETGRDLLLYLGVVALMLAPWVGHNFLKYGRWVLLNCGDGVIACWENHQEFWLLGGKLPSPLGQLDPVAYNSFLKAKALEFVWHHPHEYLRLCWDRFQRFWSFAPASHYKWYYGSQWVLGGLAITGGLSFIALKSWRHWRLTLPLTGVILFLSTLHCLTHALDRYRLPLDPALIILASLWLCDKLKVHPKAKT